MTNNRFPLFSVAVGRFVMRLVVPAIVVHELYTAAFGLYVIWLVCRAGIIIASWVPLGLGGILEKLMIWTVLVGVTGPVSSIYIYIYIWSENFRSPTGQKVKPNMADMEALSYVGFSPPVQFLLYT